MISPEKIASLIGCPSDEEIVAQAGLSKPFISDVFKYLEKERKGMSKKIHLCCGDIYLSGYENCDIEGVSATNASPYALSLNATTLDKYFKFPYEPDESKRERRFFIVNTKMNILEKWPWEDGSVDEVLMVNALEHFEHVDEVPHIINEAYRVLKSGGIFKFDFPDIKSIVEQYHDSDPEYCITLLYCNHKNNYSIHHWGYTVKSIANYLQNGNKKWDINFKDIVKHDYPSTGCEAIKK